MRFEKKSAYKWIPILLSGLVLFLFACRLSQDEKVENTISFNSIYDALAAYDSVVITLKAPDGHTIDVVYRGKVEQQMTFNRIVEQVREMNMARAGELAIYKAPSKDCTFCQWKDLCELHETGTDWKELRRMTTRKWSPYASHIWSVDLL